VNSVSESERPRDAAWSTAWSATSSNPWARGWVLTFSGEARWTPRAGVAPRSRLRSPTRA